MNSQRSKPVLGSALLNTSWLVGDRVIRMVVGLVVGIWIARYLGPENYGLLSYAAAFVSLFAWLSDLGLDRMVVRELVAGRIERARVMGTAFILKLGGGFGILIFATAAAYAISHDAVKVTLIAITAAGTIAQAFDVVDYHFQSLVQSKYATLSRSAAFQILSLCKLVLILWKAPLLAFAVAGLAETVLTAALLIVAHRLKVRLAERWEWDWATAKLLLRDSWPLAISSLMVMVYMRIDQVMLERLSSPGELGKYAGSVRLSEAWYFVLMAISTSVFPRLVDAYAVSEDQLDLTVRRYYAAMILVAYAFAVPISLSASILSRVLFGAQFNGMESMLSIGVWAGMFVGVALVRGAYCTAKNLNRFLLYSTTAGAVVNVVLNLILMPKYGGRGAAAATLISYAIAGYGTSFFYRPTVQQGKLISQLLLPWNAWRYLNWRAISL